MGSTDRRRQGGRLGLSQAEPQGVSSNTYVVPMGCTQTRPWPLLICCAPLVKCPPTQNRGYLWLNSLPPSGRLLLRASPATAASTCRAERHPSIRTSTTTTARSAASTGQPTFAAPQSWSTPTTLQSDNRVLALPDGLKLSGTDRYEVATPARGRQRDWLLSPTPTSSATKRRPISADIGIDATRQA